MSLPAKRVVSSAQNGVGAFIQQCKRMEFQYCDWGGSSAGIREFLPTRLSKFSAENPSIEFVVQKKANAHPIIRGVYLNGREKILKKAELLSNASGKKLAKVRRRVESLNSSVRGIWSPFHTQDITKIA